MRASQKAISAPSMFEEDDSFVWGTQGSSVGRMTFEREE